VLPVATFLHDLRRLLATREPIALAGCTGCGQEKDDHGNAQVLFHGLQC